MIVVRTPLRVSLFGGGTDFPDFFREHGGRTLGFAIDKYIYTIVHPRLDRQIRVSYSRIEQVERVDDLQHELIREALCMRGVKDGIEIHTIGDVPEGGVGLGTSAAVTVGALHALSEHQGLDIAQKWLARDACRIEIERLGKPVGVQDQYLTALGGLRYLHIHHNGRVSTRPPVVLGDLADLIRRLYLFYTGLERSSSTILANQVAAIPDKTDVLLAMWEMPSRACRMLARADFDGVGRLLDEGWCLKKQLEGGITKPHIDQMYSTALLSGALGGKVLGAGGGGYLLVYIPDDRLKDVLGAMQEGFNCAPTDYWIDYDGTKVLCAR